MFTIEELCHQLYS